MQATFDNGWKSALLPYFPKTIRETLKDFSAADEAEEIRIRIGKPIQILCGTKETMLGPGDSCIGENECAELLDNICFHSIYAWEDELKNGFLTLPGGYRIGLSGRAVMQDGMVKRVADVTSFNIRIARECKGCADTVMRYILGPDGSPLSSLIVSPPGCGKTTLLRDIARQLSEGSNGARACKVCIADERSELAGSWRGIPQNDLGPRTDVLDGCPKAWAMGRLLRTMSPEVIVTDEIGSEHDAKAVLDAATCGAAVLASAHGGSLNEVFKRSTIREIISSGTFKRFLLLGRSRGTGTLEQVADDDMNFLFRRDNDG
jgi:stage III sporulation protein AA